MLYHSHMPTWRSAAHHFCVADDAAASGASLRSRDAVAATSARGGVGLASTCPSASKMSVPFCVSSPMLFKFGRFDCGSAPSTFIVSRYMSKSAVFVGFGASTARALSDRIVEKLSLRYRDHYIDISPPAFINKLYSLYLLPHPPDDIA